MTRFNDTFPSGSSNRPALPPPDAAAVARPKAAGLKPSDFTAEDRRTAKTYVADVFHDCPHTTLRLLKRSHPDGDATGTALDKLKAEIDAFARTRLDALLAPLDLDVLRRVAAEGKAAKERAPVIAPTPAPSPRPDGDYIGGFKQSHRTLEVYRTGDVLSLRGMDGGGGGTLNIPAILRSPQTYHPNLILLLRATGIVPATAPTPAPTAKAAEGPRWPWLREGDVFVGRADEAAPQHSTDRMDVYATANGTARLVGPWGYTAETVVGNEWRLESLAEHRGTGGRFQIAHRLMVALAATVERVTAQGVTARGGG